MNTNEAQSLDEPADLSEVACAIIEYKGISIKEFDKLRLEKNKERGGLENKLFVTKC
ncbi:hypothetical protein [Paenibacillus sp. WLX2291]|uniref:hypothetical protein n=1 Tax=Paenibacillus sp. WLX2291 TaxID=3296934 RepID=UPI0039841522